MNSILAVVFLCIMVIIVFTFAYFYTIFYNVFPDIGGSKAAMQTIYSDTFGFFDRSFSLLMLALVIGSAIGVIVRPNVMMGLLDIVGLFLFASTFTAFRTGVIGFANAVPMNTIMPNTYAVLSSNWIALLLMGALAVECVFNFRGRKTQQEDILGTNYEEYHED